MSTLRLRRARVFSTSGTFQSFAEITIPVDPIATGGLTATTCTGFVHVVIGTVPPWVQPNPVRAGSEA